MTYILVAIGRDGTRMIADFDLRGHRIEVEPFTPGYEAAP